MNEIKKTAQEVRTPEQFTEKELYCIAKHIQWLLKKLDEDNNYDICCTTEHCKYRRHEKCDLKIRYSSFQKLEVATGITLSWWKDFKIEDIPEPDKQDNH